MTIAELQKSMKKLEQFSRCEILEDLDQSYKELLIDIDRTYDALFSYTKHKVDYPTLINENYNKKISRFAS